MIAIDAVGKDGRNILRDLDGASPTGGLVRTETRNRVRLVPGDVIRDSLGWAVVAGTAHDGILGVSTVATIDKAGEVTRRTMTSSDCAKVRTDTRIDPDTLWKLDIPRRAVLLGAQHGAAGERPFGDLGFDGDSALMDALGETGPTTRANQPHRLDLVNAYRTTWEKTARAPYDPGFVPEWLETELARA